MTRVLGVDHGSRRIGLAVGDTETGMAFARAALRRTAADRDVSFIAELAMSERIARVVVGLPLNMDGSEGSQAGVARSFGERLRAAGLEVLYFDERLTSWQAADELTRAGRRPRRATGELDSTAARLFLQEYLDTLDPSVPPGTGPPQETA